jgi:mono/diheme cytochrome c family protein
MALLLAAACARTVMPSATPADADAASRRWPGTTVADLAAGRELYIARCSGCHQPVPPDHVAPAAWPAHVAEMKERSHLDERQASLVVRYLVTMSERAVVATAQPQ